VVRLSGLFYSVEEAPPLNFVSISMLTLGMARRCLAHPAP
jgi:hypothetical protein